MTIKERIIGALRGEMVDRVPFTSYIGLFPENERDPLMKEGEIGLERFVKYCLPRYNEAAEILHEKGKRLGVHMDGNLRLLRESIAGSGIDFIEAFTPSPMFDMSAADARKAWPEKVLWINFTSCIHIEGPEAIRAHTLELLRQAYPGSHFLISITENVPDEVRKESFATIAKTLLDKGSLPLLC